MVLNEPVTPQRNNTAFTSFGVGNDVGWLPSSWSALSSSYPLLVPSYSLHFMANQSGGSRAHFFLTPWFLSGNCSRTCCSCPHFVFRYSSSDMFLLCRCGVEMASLNAMESLDDWCVSLTIWQPPIGQWRDNEDKDKWTVYRTSNNTLVCKSTGKDTYIYTPLPEAAQFPPVRTVCLSLQERGTCLDQ